MRCSILTTALAAAALALAGCSSSDAGAAAASTSSAAAAVQSGIPEDVREGIFVDTVTEAGLTRYGTRDDLVDLAHSMCAAYGRGATFPQALKTLIDNGWSARDAGEMNGATTAAFCPEHATA